LDLFGTKLQNLQKDKDEKMKSFIFAVLICVCSIIPVKGVCFADDCCVCKPNPVIVTHFKAIDVLKGVGCYTVGVTKGVACGVGQIVSAPFTTTVHIPRHRYIYHPGYYVPPRVEPYNRPRNDKAREPNKVPHRDITPIPMVPAPTPADPIINGVDSPTPASRVVSSNRGIVLN
jgi:hypothetical protein